ncbi:unnamed protein product [Prunus armeniaca]|uniref:Uncharacterized protein n=1 Tax=Prunus armeniaca TaxID=36596 RepID=A0A6J5WF54_PRUAR|nr:unnamed protein product [Prunus armeniaca]
MMRATRNMINLGGLSDEYCLSIFNHMAFSDRDGHESKVFGDISKEIVKKCKGLPLAAKTLDYEIERDDLINLWMAQDYVISKKSEEKGTTGDAVFDNLVARSFFQDFEKIGTLSVLLANQSYWVIRTLNLSGNSIKELPEEIGELKHLRHIDLSFNCILEKLPDTICGLYNLSTLRLVWCSELKKLPENMGNLINLKHLYVLLCGRLASFPKGIGRLTSLQTLDLCHCDGNNNEAFQIGDLRKLNLEGSLAIHLVGDATDKSEVEKAQLWDKKLFHLTVYFERQTNSSSSSVEILNALRPHPDLESLKILYHNGTTWPNWMQSLHNLRFLTLVGGTQCELWPLGKLEYLETLTLRSMDGVRKVGVEFLGLEDQTSFRIRSPQILFPKLKRLWFGLMLNWEEWEGVEEWTKEDSEITIMPCLSQLTITGCPLLKALPDFVFKTPLQTLRILRSERLLERYQEGNGEWAKISATNPNIRIIR